MHHSSFIYMYMYLLSFIASLLYLYSSTCTRILECIVCTRPPTMHYTPPTKLPSHGRIPFFSLLFFAAQSLQQTPPFVNVLLCSITAPKHQTQPHQYKLHKTCHQIRNTNHNATFANAQKLLENTLIAPDESLSFSPVVAGASDYIIGRSTVASVNMVMMGHDE